MFNGFYEGKKILVTGAAGVKGTWLAEQLLAAGATVTGVDNHTPEPISNFSASGLADRIRFIPGDITDLPLMTKLVDESDGVFHLAAIVIVGESRRNPLESYRSNTFGTATILEALRVSGKPKRAVIVTTDKVYKSKAGEPWVETDPLGATGPYAVSKACAEFVVEDYQDSYFRGSEIRVAVGRAGNVLIGGDRHASSRTGGAGRIFVDCFEALAEGRRPEIYSPGFSRPYTYGLDIVSGYMALMSKLDQDEVAGQAFNFGPYEEIGIPNNLLATKACELWGGETMWFTGAKREEPFEHQSLRWAKSARVLKWRPAFTFHEALQATARWYKEAVPGHSMREFNATLIAEHLTAARNLQIHWAVAS
jgi:CDP-glucose 4,6-dehydratase